jgi:hypothetical protein
MGLGLGVSSYGAIYVRYHGIEGLTSLPAHVFKL